MLILFTRTSLVVLRRGENGKGALTTLYKQPRRRSKIDLNARHILLPPIQLSGSFELKLQNFTLGFHPFRRIKKRNVPLIRFIEISPFPPSMRCFRNTKKLFLVPQASWKIHFLSTKAKHFIGQFITADDSKCRCAHSGMSGQMGGFHNPGFVCKRFLTFLSHPLPALVLAPFFARSLTLLFKTARKRLLRRLSGQRTFSTEYWGLKNPTTRRQRERRLQSEFAFFLPTLSM